MNYIMALSSNIINNKFSYSKINTFDFCPQKYKITYIDKINKSHESIEAFMGKRVHEVLDWFYKDRGKFGNFYTSDILLDRYKKLWNDKWHENVYLANINSKFDKHKLKTKFFYYLNGEKCLMNFFNRYNPNFHQDVIATELSCTVKIDDFNFKCVIDRLDKRNKTYHIYDYKTSVKPLSESKAMDDLQLLIYLLAVKNFFNDSDDIILNWYYLYSNKIISVVHSEEKIDQLRLRVIDRVNEIIKEKKFYPKENILCDWCYYWEECDIKSTKNNSIRLT